MYVWSPRIIYFSSRRVRLRRLDRDHADFISFPAERLVLHDGVETALAISSRAGIGLRVVQEFVGDLFGFASTCEVQLRTDGAASNIIVQLFDRVDCAASPDAPRDEESTARDGLNSATGRLPSSPQPRQHLTYTSLLNTSQNSLLVQPRIEMQAEHVTTRRRNVKGQAKSADFHALSYSVTLFLGLALARRDFSFDLLSTAINLCALTQETLDHCSRDIATIDRIWESVSALREALGRFEERDFDGDDVLKEEDLVTLAGTLIDSFNAILTTLEFIIRKEPFLSSSSKGLSGQSMISMYYEKRQVITSTVVQLELLLLKIER